MKSDRMSAIREMDLHAAQAWPAAIVEERDGWLLRRTPGVSRRRSNSALTPINGAKSVEAVEEFYREHGVPVRVQVSPVECHPSLDAMLGERGYSVGGRTAVLTAAVEDVAADPQVPVEVEETPDTWVKVFTELDHHDDSEVVATSVISRISAPAAFLSVWEEGHPVGMGLVVGGSRWAGVFCMATAPEHRRRGVARSVLGAGARWAAGQRAERLYLQVERDNGVARRLYERAGFIYSHGYHFWTSP
ncbi:GNAT family N-acetyltransferase [Thermopolyspora sp. NPDC052614]|uniref:GNAT family N-acetyltransferase n=1 Tax=Thermopolyspora sp. NPDC052614 TaxID=3155682 RepID=UPI003442F26D